MAKFSKLFLGKGYLKTAFIILVICLIGYFVIWGMGLKEGLDAPGNEEFAQKILLCAEGCVGSDDDECLRKCTAQQ
jgi:hypothetical protein